MQAACVAEISFAAKKQDKAFGSGHRCFFLQSRNRKRKWMDEDIKGLFTLFEGRANMWKLVHK